MLDHEPLEGYEIEVVLKVRDVLEPYVKAAGSDAVFDNFQHAGYYDRERMILACVNSKLMITAVHTVSIGTLTASVIHPREIFKIACVANASGIIMIHNHPSGDPSPSAEDNMITDRIEECGKIMGIPLLDHLVIGRDDYYSYSDAGCLSGQGAGYRGMVMK